MLELFKVAAKMVLDRSEYDRDVTDVDKSGKTLAENLSGYFEKAKKVLTGVLSAVAIQKVASGIWNLAKETSAAGDRIDKTSQALGMSRKAFQEWDYILAQSGASIDSMGMSMKTMNEAISANSAETAVALSRLGLSAARLQNLSPEQQFEELVRAFQKMPPSAKKSEYALMLFGRNAQSLMPLLNSASGSVDELRNRAHELGLIMSDEDVNASVAFGDALDDLNRVWTAVKQKFGAQMLPTFTRGLVAAANSLGRVGNTIANAFKTGDWSAVFDTITTEVKTLLPKFINTVVNIGVGLFQNADKIVSLGFSIITGITSGLRENIPTLVKKIPDIFKSMVDGIKDLGTEAGNGVIDMINSVFGTNIPHLEKITWASWADVEKTFGEAWEGIKKEAEKKMKLVFGEDADGNIDWPDAETLWTKIGEKFSKFWGGIQDKAKKVLIFFFGTDDKGGINWPNAKVIWAKVKDGFATFWKGIQDSANDVLKFVFGEDKDGNIKWPDRATFWGKISGGLAGLWEGIQKDAESVLKFFFGTDAEGGINWPNPTVIWAKVQKGFGEFWEGIQKNAKAVLKFIFGEDENGGIDFPDVPTIWAKISSPLDTFWKGIQGKAKDVLKFIFGENDDGNIDFPTTAEVRDKVINGLKTFWKGVQDNATGILKFFFGIDEKGGINWPNPKVIWAKAQKGFDEFWKGIQEAAKDVLKLIFGETEDGGISFPSTKEVISKVISGLKMFWSGEDGKGGVVGAAKDVLKLVFGEDDEGGIKWPEASAIWEKAKGGLEKLWKGIQENAKDILKLAFGEEEDGGIKWPKEIGDFLSTAQSVFSWIEEHAASVIQTLTDVGGAVGTAIVSAKLIEFVSMLGTSSQIGLVIGLLVTLVQTIQSTDWSGIGEGAGTLQEFFGSIGEKVEPLELLKSALQGIAAGVIAATVAAHPYISALAAIVALLTYIRGEGGPEGMLKNNLFGGFSKEDLSVLQEYIDAYNGYNDAVNQLQAMYLEGKDGTDEYRQLESSLDALDSKRLDTFEKLKKIQTESGKDLLSAYMTWYHEQVGSESGVLFDVPIDLTMDDEDLKKDVKQLDLSAKVKLFPDTSALNGFTDSGYSYAFGFAKGLNYVPNDGLYRLHRGEAILNQDQGRDWRQNNSGFNAQQLYSTVASAVAAAVGDIQINMNGKAVANAVSGQVSRNLYQDALGRRFAPV